MPFIPLDPLYVFEVLFNLEAFGTNTEYLLSSAFSGWHVGQQKPWLLRHHTRSQIAPDQPPLMPMVGDGCIRQARFANGCCEIGLHPRYTQRDIKKLVIKRKKSLGSKTTKGAGALEVLSRLSAGACITVIGYGKSASIPLRQGT
jgi:hypothetical protein